MRECMDNVVELQAESGNWRIGLKYGMSNIYYFRGASLARPDDAGGSYKYNL